jgi:hypothetical protein
MGRSYHAWYIGAVTLDQSVTYLASDAALASLEADVYWPKWHSPWWHALLLFELGEAARIPGPVTSALAAAVDRFPVKTFPTEERELAALDPYRDILCHCALGSVYQVLAACGVDVDAALPWIEPWLVRYQMADGGLNCDAAAYRVADECASSMVGTIAAFEAMLVGAPARWSAERRRFVDRAARFLVERRLVDGSPSRHNAEERDAAAGWRACCFPRFYFYDVLRGASALLVWSRKTGASLPAAVVRPVVDDLVAIDHGVVRVGRRAHAGRATLARDATGGWTRRPEASSFPLLDACSTLGAEVPVLTARLAELRAVLA